MAEPISMQLKQWWMREVIDKHGAYNELRALGLGLDGQSAYDRLCARASRGGAGEGWVALLGLGQRVARLEALA